MKFFLLVLLLAPALFAQSAAYPDAPSSTTKHEERATWKVTVERKPVSFWTFRKSWEDPALRSNKQVFKSKVFWLTHAGLWAATIVATRNPRSGEENHSELPVAAVLTGMDYFFMRWVGAPMALGPPVYGMIHYSLAARK